MDDSNSKLLKFLKNLRKRNFRPTGGEEEKGFEGTEAADKGFEPLYKEVAPSSLPWDWPSIDPDFMDALKSAIPSDHVDQQRRQGNHLQVEKIEGPAKNI